MKPSDLRSHSFIASIFSAVVFLVQLSLSQREPDPVPNLLVFLLTGLCFVALMNMKFVVKRANVYVRM